MLHIGDTNVDKHYAELAGLEFFYVDAIPDAGADGWVF